jgi:hypothetical protein
MIKMTTYIVSFMGHCKPVCLWCIDDECFCYHSKAMRPVTTTGNGENARLAQDDALKHLSETYILGECISCELAADVKERVQAKIKEQQEKNNERNNARR